MQSKSSAAAAFLLLVSSTVHAFGGDVGGNAGETRYSREVLLIADQLIEFTSTQDPIASRAMKRIVTSQLSIRPTDEELDQENGQIDVDALSYREGNVYVTKLEKKSWDHDTCRAKYFLVMHELLVHAQLEVGHSYPRTQPVITAMESQGKIDCRILIEKDPQVVSYEKKGCPVSFVELIARVADGQALASVATERNTETLIRNSGRALTIRNAAQLCIDYMNRQEASPVIRRAFDALALTNDTMVNVTLEVMTEVRDTVSPLVDAGMMGATTAITQTGYEKWAQGLLNTQIPADEITDPYARAAVDLATNQLGMYRREFQYQTEAQCEDARFRAIHVQSLIESLNELVLAYRSSHETQW